MFSWGNSVHAPALLSTFYEILFFSIIRGTEGKMGKINDRDGNRTQASQIFALTSTPTFNFNLILTFNFLLIDPDSILVQSLFS